MTNNTEKVYKLGMKHTFMVTKILRAINLDIGDIVNEGVANFKLMTSNVSSEEVTTNEHPMLRAAEIWSGLATKVITEIIYNYEHTEKELVALISAVSGLTKKQVEDLDLDEYFDILTAIFYRDNGNFFKRFTKLQLRK